MDKAVLNQIHPVLPVRNVSDSIRFYVQKLGFELAFKDNGDDPKYGGVTRDGLEIHLQWHDANDWTQGMDCTLLRIYVEQVDVLFGEYQSKDIFHDNTMLRNTAWGTREFGFYDIDGNGLIFYRNFLSME